MKKNRSSSSTEWISNKTFQTPINVNYSSQRDEFYLTFPDKNVLFSEKITINRKSNQRVFQELKEYLKKEDKESIMRYDSSFIKPTLKELKKYSSPELLGLSVYVDKNSKKTYCRHTIKENKNYLFTGGTGSGKTEAIKRVLSCYSRNSKSNSSSFFTKSKKIVLCNPGEYNHSEDYSYFKYLPISLEDIRLFIKGIDESRKTLNALLDSILVLEHLTLQDIEETIIPLLKIIESKNMSTTILISSQRVPEVLADYSYKDDFIHIALSGSNFAGALIEKANRERVYLMGDSYTGRRNGLIEYSKKKFKIMPITVFDNY